MSTIITLPTLAAIEGIPSTIAKSRTMGSTVGALAMIRIHVADTIARYRRAVSDNAIAIKHTKESGFPQFVINTSVIVNSAKDRESLGWLLDEIRSNEETLAAYAAELEPYCGVLATEKIDLDYDPSASVEHTNHSVAVKTVQPTAVANHANQHALNVIRGIQGKEMTQTKFRELMSASESDLPGMLAALPSATAAEQVTTPRTAAGEIPGLAALPPAMAAEQVPGTADEIAKLARAFVQHNKVGVRNIGSLLKAPLAAWDNIVATFTNWRRGEPIKRLSEVQSTESAESNGPDAERRRAIAAPLTSRALTR